MDTLIKISKGISFVFNPIIIPSYALALLLGVTELALLPLSTRLLTLAIIFALTGLLPLMIIGGLRSLKLVGSMSLTQRTERTFPYACTTALYIVAVIYLYMVGAPAWLMGFMIGATLAILIVTIVNRWWKISAHASAIGGLLALVTTMSMHAVAMRAALIMLIIVVMIAGLVGVARLILQAHTPMQIYAGYLNGFISVFLFCTII